MHYVFASREEADEYAKFLATCTDKAIEVRTVQPGELKSTHARGLSPRQLPTTRRCLPS